MTQKLVVALDIDGTQYSFSRPEWDAAARRLADLLTTEREAGNIFLVHNTGRPFPWCAHGGPNESYTNPIIAKPDVIISNAGTAMWRPPFDKPWDAWRDHVASIVAPETIETLKRDLRANGVTLHPENEENEFKICCEVDPARQNEAVSALRAFIHEKHGDLFEVFYWNADTVDVTPKGANKDDALRFLLEYEGLENNAKIVAGDSMNDWPVMQNPDYQRILVGNAADPMKDALRNKPNVFIANDDQPAAAGVLAGLSHFNVTPKPQPVSTPQKLIIG